MEYEHPVFGPDRPGAAIAAINELQQAQHAARNTAWIPSESASQRVAQARRVRAMYPDYGDSFRGH